MKRLNKGNFYRFNDRGRVFVGEYMGKEDFSCCVCDKGNSCRCFNVYYGKDWGMYETFGYGADHFPEVLEDLGKSNGEPILNR